MIMVEFLPPPSNRAGDAERVKTQTEPASVWISVHEHVHDEGQNGRLKSDVVRLIVPIHQRSACSAT